MRPILYAAVRAVFSYVLGPIAAVLWICGLSASAQGQGSYAFSPDGHTLALYGARNVQIGTVLQRQWRVGGTDVETLAVDVAATHRFQWATDVAPGYAAGVSVTRESVEIRSQNLGPAAARHAGWRDLARIDDYIVPVGTFVGKVKRDGQAFLCVKTDARRSGFLIVAVTVVRPVKK